MFDQLKRDKKSGSDQTPTQEECAVVPEALRRAAASLKGRAFVPDSEVVKVPIDEAFPISAAILRAEKERAAEALKNPQTGQLVAGQGTYLCRAKILDNPDDARMSIVAPADTRQGTPWDFFAAPESLEPVSAYNDTVKEIASRKNWHGFDGANYKNASQALEAFRNKTYDGKWIIPFGELVHGKDLDGNEIAIPCLYSSKDIGAFANTFITKSDGSDCAHWYWTCTEHRDHRALVYTVVFTDGYVGWDPKDNFRLSCRPVRARLVI